MTLHQVRTFISSLSPARRLTIAAAVLAAGLGVALWCRSGGRSEEYLLGGRTFSVSEMTAAQAAFAKANLPGAVSDGISKSVAPGTVLAAVGWRAGNRVNSDGTVQSPGNGLYRSSTGEPGSFVKLAAPGFTVQDRIGRIELERSRTVLDVMAIDRRDGWNVADGRVSQPEVHRKRFSGPAPARRHDGAAAAAAQRSFSASRLLGSKLTATAPRIARPTSTWKPRS